jgi:hypothetical protein
MEQEEIEHAILVRDLVSCLSKYPGAGSSAYTALWFVCNIARKWFTNPENKRLGLISNRMEIVKYIRTNHKDIWNRLIKYLPVDYLEKGTNGRETT